MPASSWIRRCALMLGVSIPLCAALFAWSMTVVQGCSGGTGGNCAVTAWDLGWPFAALERTHGEECFLDGGEFRSKASPANGTRISSPSLLFANLCVLFCVSLGMVVFCRWLWRFLRRPRITLQGLVLAASMMTLVFGTWGYWACRRNQERRIAAELRGIGWRVREEPGATLPQCLVVLLSNVRVAPPDSTCRINEIVWERVCAKSGEIRSADATWTDVNAMLRDAEPLLLCLAYCRQVVVQDAGLDDEGTGVLCRALSSCTAVEFATQGTMTDRTLETIAGAWPRLEVLHLDNGRFTDAGMEHVYRFSRLRNLKITGAAHFISPAACLRILSLPGLRVFEYPESWEEMPCVMEDARKRDIECGACIAGPREWSPAPSAVEPGREGVGGFDGTGNGGPRTHENAHENGTSLISPQ